MIERYHKTVKAIVDTLSTAQVDVVISYLTTIVRKYVVDPDQRKQVAEELRRIPEDALI